MVSQKVNNLIIARINSFKKISSGQFNRCCTVTLERASRCGDLMPDSNKVLSITNLMRTSWIFRPETKTSWLFCFVLIVVVKIRLNAFAFFFWGRIFVKKNIHSSENSTENTERKDDVSILAFANLQWIHSSAILAWCD